MLWSMAKSLILRGKLYHQILHHTAAAAASTVPLRREVSCCIQKSFEINKFLMQTHLPSILKQNYVTK